MADQPQDSGVNTAGVRSAISQRAKLVSAAHSPLGFFVLALLIVEVFLVGAGMTFGLSADIKIAALGIGVFLFLIVFTTVVWLVVKYPQNLVFSEESHVQFEAMRVYASKSQPQIPMAESAKTSDPSGVLEAPTSPRLLEGNSDAEEE